MTLDPARIPEGHRGWHVEDHKVLCECGHDCGPADDPTGSLMAGAVTSGLSAMRHANDLYATHAYAQLRAERT